MYTCSWPSDRLFRLLIYGSRQLALQEWDWAMDRGDVRLQLS